MKQLFLMLLCIMLIASCHISRINDNQYLIVTDITQINKDRIILTLRISVNSDYKFYYYTSNSNYRVGDKFKLVKIEEQE